MSKEKTHVRDGKCNSRESSEGMEGVLEEEKLPKTEWEEGEED